MKKLRFVFYQVLLALVSILVVMEVGEEGCVRLGMQKSEIRFNPCCNGSG